MSSTSALNSLLSSSTSSTSGVDLSSLLTAATGASSTGIDVTSAVDAAIYAAQAPERQWQSEQSTIESQITALTSIQTAASSVSTDLENLADPLGVLASKTVSSSNQSAVTGTATSTATTGTHTVAVSQLATAATWYSSVVAGNNASLGSSSLTITQANGAQTSFSLGSSGSNTLAALAQTINAAGLGISASVVQSSSGARLSLVGQTTGAAANFTVTDGSSPAASWSSADLVSASSALSAGSFQVTDGSSSASISIQAGDKLSNVADQINASGLSLNASVVQDSSGAHLAISSTDGQNVSVSSDPALAFVQPIQAQDAELQVDGVPISSGSNTVSGAISGVTLNLTAMTPNSSPATLNITADSSQIGTAVQQFVSDYNSAISLLNTQFTFSTSTSSQGVLGSDTTVRSLQSMLLGALGYSAPSGSTSSGLSLASLGISMNNDGTLSLDSTALTQAIASNASGVQDFFQGSGTTGFANAMEKQLAGFTDPSSGTLDLDISALTQQYNDLQTDVNNYQSGYIASQQTLLTSMYSKAEIALQSLPTTLKQIQSELGSSSGS